MVMLGQSAPQPEDVEEQVEDQAEEQNVLMMIQQK